MEEKNGPETNENEINATTDYAMVLKRRNGQIIGDSWQGERNFFEKRMILSSKERDLGERS